MTFWDGSATLWDGKVISAHIREGASVGQLFIDVAHCVAGRFAGGPAKVSVLASGMMGMISGSSIANTVMTGSLTIPTMKRIGYKPHFAGAVEAARAAQAQRQHGCA